MGLDGISAGRRTIDIAASLALPDQSTNEFGSALRRISIVLRAAAIPPKMSATEMASVSPMNFSPRASMLRKCVPIRKTRPVRVIRIADVLHRSSRRFGTDLVERVKFWSPEGLVWFLTLHRRLNIQTTRW
jgi:hypothetical protein